MRRIFLFASVIGAIAPTSPLEVSIVDGPRPRQRRRRSPLSNPTIERECYVLPADLRPPPRTLSAKEIAEQSRKNARRKRNKRKRGW